MNGDRLFGRRVMRARGSRRVRSACCAGRTDRLIVSDVSCAAADHGAGPKISLRGLGLRWSTYSQIVGPMAAAGSALRHRPAALTALWPSRMKAWTGRRHLELDKVADQLDDPAACCFNGSGRPTRRCSSGNERSATPAHGVKDNAALLVALRRFYKWGSRRKRC